LILLGFFVISMAVSKVRLRMDIEKMPEIRGF